MIITTLRFKVPGDRRKDFLDSAKLITGPTQVLPGCMSCGFFLDLNDPDVVLLVEEWESRERHVPNRIVLDGTFRTTS